MGDLMIAKWMGSHLRIVLSAVVSCAVVFGLLAAAPAAHADTTYIYWTTNNGTTTGRAEIDGSNENDAFFPAGGTSWGIAVNGSSVFWSVDRSVASGTKIGRANLDGTSPNPDFLSTSLPPYGLAINSQYIYWANHSRNSIGRANLDGTGAVLDFITGVHEPVDVAVDSNYIYWASLGPSPYFGTGKIGRANLDGTGVNLDFITGASNPQGVAVTSTYVYWSNGLGNIGRANINGSSPNQDFIHLFSANPAGIAVDGSHIYWAAVTAKQIQRANLNGTGANVFLDFTASGTQPWGVAIGTTPSPPPVTPPDPTPQNNSDVPEVTPAALPEVFPNDLMQSIAVTADATCDGLGDPSMNWSGIASGGWTKSWARWPYDGVGGWVCNRMIHFSSSSHTWNLMTGAS